MKDNNKTTDLNKEILLDNYSKCIKKVNKLSSDLIYKYTKFAKEVKDYN